MGRELSPPQPTRKADIALPGRNPAPQSYGTSLAWDHTMCYLLPDTSERALPNPSHAGWYSIYLPGGMEG